MKLFVLQAKQKEVDFTFDCKIPTNMISQYFVDIDSKKMSQVGQLLF